jgi:hypothetical protein
MTTPSRDRSGRRAYDDFRGWAISLLVILVAALLIAGIAKWGNPPPPATAEEQTIH